MKVLECNTVIQFTYFCVAPFVNAYYPFVNPYYPEVYVVLGERLEDWGRPTATYIWVKSYVTTGCGDALA